MSFEPRKVATALGGNCPELLGGLDEAVRVRSCRPRYHRAVLARQLLHLDRTKSLYRGHAHYIFLLNSITRGLRK